MQAFPSGRFVGALFAGEHDLRVYETGADYALLIFVVRTEAADRQAVLAHFNRRDDLAAGEKPPKCATDRGAEQKRTAPRNPHGIAFRQQAAGIAER